MGKLLQNKVRNCARTYRINKPTAFTGGANTLGGQSAVPADVNASAAREARAKAAEARMAAAAAAKN
jgi:hypothetical protein